MSTLEILIALSIFTLSLTAIVMLAFGSQSVVVDSETSGIALSVAKEMLEGERALAHQDFKLANPTTTARSAGTLAMSASVAVSQTDLATKQATSTVTWESGGRLQYVTLSTVLTNARSLYDDDTCSSIVTGDWSRPVLSSSALMDLIGTTTGPYPVSDVDAYNGKLYVTVARTPYRTDPTLFIIDLADHANPALLGKLDNASSGTGGLAAVRIAESMATSTIYAYAASATSFSAGQLQIFDVTQAENPRLLTTYKIPLADVPSAGLGNTLAYRGGYVYLGLTATSGDGLNIIDVRDPVAPVWKGGYASGNHDVNAIAVRGDYVYIATPATEEVKVINVASADAPQYVAGFNAPSGGGNGKSLYAVGTTLSVGKTIPNAGPEYYRLDISSPEAIQTGNATPVAGEIGSSANGVIMRDFLSFLLTNTEFTIINATSTVSVGTIALPASGSSFEPSMDCEGNSFYVGSNDASGNGVLSVIDAS